MIGDISISEPVRQEILSLYQEHKDLIDSDAQNGSGFDMRIAKTIQVIAGSDHAKLV